MNCISVTCLYFFLLIIASQRLNFLYWKKYHANSNSSAAYFEIMQLYKLNIETNLNLCTLS